MSIYPSVRHAFEDLARWLHHSHDVNQTLSMLTASALETIPGVDHVSITVRERRGRLSTLAPTDLLAVAIDDLQYELREGPCYEAALEGEGVLLATDLAHDQRWPAYGPRAAALGVGSQMGLSLVADGGSRAVLNLYSERVGGFDDDREMAELFASHAALVLGYARTVKDLDEAINSRTVIGQAIGILMERYDLDEDRAFGFLTRVSQTSNVKLRQVARELVEAVNAQRNRGEGPRRSR
ncbi:MAG: GAF and ANTAR domain-containing protein [Nocardioidaceae bacterium]